MSVLDVAVHDGIALVTMNRPEKHNAINPEMMVRLADTWNWVREDSEVRVAVLTGAGEKAFCTGGDMTSLLPLLTRARAPRDEWDERIRANQREVISTAMLRTPDFPKPIVAAVGGLARAGGMELLLATDIRVAAPRASFGLTEVQRGLIPGGGSVVRLPRQVPHAVAMEMLLLGEPITAERAHHAGLVNTVTDDPLDAAKSIARTLANNGPLAITTIKSVVLRSQSLSWEDAYALEDEGARVVFRSSDATEGVTAFAQKRPPRFTGK
jgi:enoyl-CoA hydratase